MTDEPVAVPVMEYAPIRERPPRPWGKGFIAVCGSLLWPGIGHFIVGPPRRAIIWLLTITFNYVGSAICLASPKLLPALVILVPLFPVLFVIMLVDAFLAGRRSQRYLGPAWFRYGMGIIFLLLVHMLNPNVYVNKYMQSRYMHSYVISSGAMLPTLAPGDCFLVHKREPARRWDLVVFNHPAMGNADYVFRLIGLPGDTIEIGREGQLNTNGQFAVLPADVNGYENLSYTGRNDPALSGQTCAGCAGHPIYLCPDEYYVLGDNTSRALDSRMWETNVDGHQRGALPGSHLHSGRVTAIYWPPSRWRLFN